MNSEDRYDASSGGALPDHAQPDAPAAQALEDQLGAIFAAALADEPASRVTAASVLAEVRATQAHPERTGPSRWAEWFAGAGWKWGSGLVAAAALAVAVVVTVPQGSSSDSAADTAAGAAEMADAGMADMPASEPSPESMANRDDSAADSALVAQGPSVADAPSDSGYDSGAGDEADAAAGSPAPAVALPPLTDAEWSAAMGALPAGIDAGHLTDGQQIQSSAVRGATIGLSSPDSTIIVVAGADTGPGTDDPGDGDAGDTVGSTAERLRHAGLVTVQVADGTNRVAVAATESAMRSLTRADLTRIAQAVLEAS